MINFLAVVGAIVVIAVILLFFKVIICYIIDSIMDMYISKLDRKMIELLKQKQKLNNLLLKHEVFTLHFSHITPEIIKDLEKQMTDILEA